MLKLQPGHDGSTTLKSLKLGSALSGGPDDQGAVDIDDPDSTMHNSVCSLLNQLLAAKVQHSHSNEAITSELERWASNPAVNSEFREAIKAHASTYDKAMEFLQQRLMKLSQQQVLIAASIMYVRTSLLPWHIYHGTFVTLLCCPLMRSLVLLFTTSAKTPSAPSCTGLTSVTGGIVPYAQEPGTRDISHHLLDHKATTGLPRRWCTCQSEASYSICSATPMW